MWSLWKSEKQRTKVVNRRNERFKKIKTNRKRIPSERGGKVNVRADEQTRRK